MRRPTSLPIVALLLSEAAVPAAAVATVGVVQGCKKDTGTVIAPMDPPPMIAPMPPPMPDPGTGDTGDAGASLSGVSPLPRVPIAGGEEG